MFFKLPSLKTSGQGDFPTQPRKLKRWLEELPLVNMGDTTRQFFEALRQLNTQDLAPAHRLELLELMRPTAKTVLDHLGRHFINRTVPLPEKSARVAELNRAMLTELATGYARAANELLATGRTRDKGLALAAYRAARYWSGIIIHSWRLYETPPPGAWREIYRIYRAAEANDLLERPVLDDTLQGPGRGHIAQCFKRICLLALAHPLSLRQGEIDRLADFLDSASATAVVSADPMPDSNNGVHMLDLEGDAPPVYCRMQDLPQGPAARSINLAPLIREIRERIQSGDKATVRDMGPDNLRRVLEAWTRKARRRFSRATRDDEINVSIGLASICTTIAEELRARQAPEHKTPGIDHLALQSIGDPSRPVNGHESSFLSETDALGDAQAWDMVGRGNIITEAYTGRPPVAAPITAVGLFTTKVDGEPWQMVDASAGGYRLRWRGDQGCRAQVGELIGLREKEGSRYQWRVGVIRWMLNKANRGLEIGVQILAPRTVLVGLAASRMGRPVADFLDVLMLPAIRTIRQPPTLLVPAGRFRVGDEALVTLGKRFLRVKLDGISEHTSQFVQYRYTNLEQTAERTDPAKETGSGTTFDDVWTLI